MITECQDLKLSWRISLRMAYAAYIGSASSYSGRSVENQYSRLRERFCFLESHLITLNKLLHHQLGEPEKRQKIRRRIMDAEAQLRLIRRYLNIAEGRCEFDGLDEVEEV